MKQLTFQGKDSLWLSIWGARTLEDIERMKALKVPEPRVYPKQVEVSEEMGIRNERCIDRYGCSEY